MNKTKTISADEIKSFIEGYETIASSERENKWLSVSFYGVLTVRAAGKTIYEGKNIDKAVKAYNSITERYINPAKNFKL